jgi:tetratricopeptide (TPR) repeat protein
MSYVHEGHPDKALEFVRKGYALAEADEDLATMSGDLILIGIILLESDRPDEALASFAEAVDLSQRAVVPDEVKETTQRNQLYREARVALEKGDLKTAQSKAKVYGKQVATHQIPFEVRLTHELAGRIALREKDYDTAVTELAQANQQDPIVLHLSALACEGKGDLEQARAFCQKAANFNALNFNYAYVRAKAQKMLQELDS